VNLEILRAAASDREPARFGTDAFYAAIGRAFLAMCAVVPVLFGIEAVNTALAHHLNGAGGIRPRHLSGLDGVVFAPFLHASFTHVVGNGAPLILLGTFVLAGGAKRFLASTVLIMLVSGLGTWVTGDANSVVIGASGVVFGYLGVLLARGVVERTWWNTVVGVLIGLLYGWQLVSVLPGTQGISWQAHLFGFLGGIGAAVLFYRPHRPHRPEPGATTENVAVTDATP